MVFQNQKSILISLASCRRGHFPLYAIHGRYFLISFSPRFCFDFHLVFVSKMFILQTGSELINTKFNFKRSKQIKTKTRSRTIQFCHAERAWTQRTHRRLLGGVGAWTLGHGSRAALQCAAGHFALICFMRSTFWTHLAALIPVSASGLELNCFLFRYGE